ncbi:MAG: efflux RND transporter periplasmic adaptor subunit [Deltaproteobacteria bacterium]|nr:efflux RND transporter periplasmic adaptor subunit [Deltaproteobacteria bacterium]
MLNKNTRIACCGLVVLLVFLTLSPGCKQTEKEAKKKSHPIPVITGEVTTRRVEYILHQVGTLEARYEVTIRSEIDARIVEILFSEGKEVRKGDVLVRLDAAKIEADIRSLEARIRQLEVRLANKQRTLRRNRPLVERDLVSRLQFDNLQTEIEETAAEIAQAQANLAGEKERLSDSTIRAPFDGVAGARNISVGDYLKEGDQVVTVVDLDTLKIAFHVPEKLKANLSIGQEVTLTVSPYPDRIFKGRISFISPLVDIDTRTFQIKARLDNRQRLLNPGMFVRAQLITEVHENALIVPWESVIQTEDETYIYIVEGDMARKVPVRLGKITNEWAEVFEPHIPPGINVILEGKFAARDGMKVSVQNGQQGEKAKRLRGS